MLPNNAGGLRSTSSLETRADNLIRAFQDFIGDEGVPGRIDGLLATENRPRTHSEVHEVVREVTGFRDLALGISESPGFAQLPEDKRADIETIALHSHVALDDIADEDQPDRKWGKLDARQKLLAVGQQLIDSNVLEGFKARVKLRRTQEPIADEKRPKKLKDIYPDGSSRVL